MSLDARYLTNGKKTLYVAIDSSASPAVRYVGATKEDIPKSIRDHLPDGEPKLIGPDIAAILHVQDIFYPNFPACGHPDYPGKRCIAESCKFADPTYKDCPYFDKSYEE